MKLFTKDKVKVIYLHTVAVENQMIREQFPETESNGNCLQTASESKSAMSHSCSKGRHCYRICKQD